MSQSEMSLGERLHRIEVLVSLMKGAWGFTHLAEDALAFQDNAEIESLLATVPSKVRERKLEAIRLTINTELVAIVGDESEHIIWLHYQPQRPAKIVRAKLAGRDWVTFIEAPKVTDYSETAHVTTHEAKVECFHFKWGQKRIVHTAYFPKANVLYVE